MLRQRGLGREPPRPGRASIAAGAAPAADAGGWHKSTLMGAAWPRCGDGREAPSQEPRRHPGIPPRGAVASDTGAREGLEQLGAGVSPRRAPGCLEPRSGTGALPVARAGMLRAAARHGTGGAGGRGDTWPDPGVGQSGSPTRTRPCTCSRLVHRLPSRRPPWGPSPLLLRAGRRRPARGRGGRGWRGARRPRCAQSAGLNSSMHLAPVILVFK